MNQSPVNTPSAPRKLTHAELQFIRGLKDKKQRDTTGLFVGEGPKVVEEMARYFPCQYLVGTQEWYDGGTSNIKSSHYIQVSEAQLPRISNLKTPQQVLGVFEKPAQKEVPHSFEGGLALAIDCLQNPGNLGTIMRTADWFGIHTIYASADTADCFSPKVVQATMGALGRVKVFYTNLPALLTRLSEEGTTICGAFMEGENLYGAEIPQPAVIVMGNEGNGISQAVEAVCNRRLTIPRFTAQEESSESLNVAIATSIVCSELKRRTLD